MDKTDTKPSKKNVSSIEWQKVTYMFLKHPKNSKKFYFQKWLKKTLKKEEEKMSQAFLYLVVFKIKVSDTSQLFNNLKKTQKAKLCHNNRWLTDANIQLLTIYPIGYFNSAFMDIYPIGYLGFVIWVCFTWLNNSQSQPTNQPFLCPEWPWPVVWMIFFGGWDWKWKVWIQCWLLLIFTFIT